MKIIWKLEAEEIAQLSSFVSARRVDVFVRSRIEKNVVNPSTSIEIDRFWWVLVACLLSSQQRSGPDSPVARFLKRKPFPLRYEFYQGQADPLPAGERVLKAAGGRCESSSRSIRSVISCEGQVLYPLATQQIAIGLDDGVLVNYNKCLIGHWPTFGVE